MSDRLDRYQEPNCTEVICVCDTSCDYWFPTPYDETLGVCIYEARKHGVTTAEFTCEGLECVYGRTVDVWS